MLTRRDFLKTTSGAMLAMSLAPLARSQSNPATSPTTKSSALRCINIVNFIRAVEPRGPMDLMLPVQKQMESILAHKLPATWLLQFDVLVSGPFVPYLKEHKAADHEIGFWFEMNEMHCKAADVEWRGRPGFEWDSHPPVAFTIGYTKDERIKLADAAMREFKRTWGFTPKSVASWNLDAFTLAHLIDQYGVDAFAVCRDQVATDGFTIWGAPIAGYFPSKTNCWSPAVDPQNQLSAPVLRMLGQDPVYYYKTYSQLPTGQRIGEPDTMEPAWTSGRMPMFIDRFMKMIVDNPSLDFAYAQLGQENSFGWPVMADGFAMQMELLAKLRESNKVNIETMSDTGRRFKQAFTTTPSQAQVQLEDPFGNSAPAETTVWYQSKFYRANLHFEGDRPFFRDLTIYSDRYAQPFLNDATRDLSVEQRMPAVLDGFHWNQKIGTQFAGGFFYLDRTRLRMTRAPTITEVDKTLIVVLPLSDGRSIQITFDERGIAMQLNASAATDRLTVSFEWDPRKSALSEVHADRVTYQFNHFDYEATIAHATATATHSGWSMKSDEKDIYLGLAQTNG